MKICLVTTPIRPKPTVYPPFWFNGNNPVSKKNRWSKYKNLYHIDYFRFSHDEILEYFKYHQFDMVGISAVVSTAYAYTEYLSHLIKSIKKDTILFLGGV